MTDDKITLEVNGQTYQGWKSAQVVSGLNQIASQFAVAVTEKYPGGDNIRIRPGAKVVVKIGDEVVVTGYVDKTPISYNATSVTHSVSGRSRTADLADCCVETGLEEVKPQTAKASSSQSRYAGIEYQANGKKVASAPKTQVKPAPKGSDWRNVNAGAMIARWIEPYKIALKTNIGVIKVEGKTSVSVGKKITEAIKELIKSQNLLATDDEFGDLILWGEDQAIHATDSLVVDKNDLPTNIKEASCQFNYENVYADYMVFGQPKADKKSTKAKNNLQSNSVHSDVLGDRHRVLKIFQSGDVDTKKLNERAKFEAKYRLAVAKTATFKVCGWRQSDGSLWRKGMRVAIKDTLLGFDEEMIISKVTYDLNAGGTTTTLELMPEDAFLQPQEDSWSGAKRPEPAKGSATGEAKKEATK